MDMSVEQLKAKLAEFRHDPARFVRVVIGAEPTKQQLQILNSVALPDSHTAIRSGHGTGKSTALAWCGLWFVSCFEDCRAPYTAPSGSQLSNIIWGEFGKWHNQMMPFFRDKLTIATTRGAERLFHIEDPTNRYAVARTSRRENPDALQGFHATNMLFTVEEASGVYEPLFNVIEGALSTPGARLVMAGNPTSTSGYFYEAFNVNRDEWTRIHLSCEDSELVSEKYIEDMAAKYGRDSDIFRVRVLGDFPRASISQLISTELAMAATKVKLVPRMYNFAPKVLGVDVAWEGDDRSCIVMRQGLALEVKGWWRNIASDQLGQIIAKIEDEEEIDATFVDVGWGTGVIDYLRSIGRNPIPVNFGGRALQPEKYVNKRTEMWCQFKDWLEGGGYLPDDKDLIADLTGPQYGFAGSAYKFQLEHKSDMKRRGLPSPDAGDAAVLTLAAPVTKKKMFGTSPRPIFANTTFDPLEAAWN